MSSLPPPAPLDPDGSAEAEAVAIGARVMEPSVRHPLLGALIAIAIATAATIAIGDFAGLHEIGRAFGHFRLRPLFFALLVQVASLFRYVLAYEAVVEQAAQRPLPRHISVRLVVVGFGAFTAGGGFGFDQRILRRLNIEPDAARLSVLVLGGLEFLSLVWIAWVAALVVLILDDPHVPDGFSWPFLTATPVGTLLAVALARSRRAGRLTRDRPVAAALMASLRQVLVMARRPREYGFVWAGIFGYWLADMLSLGFALRAFGAHIGFGALILAYASGYLFSRRSLPLGGAGLIEVLMTLSLHWLHVPLAPALAGVVAYRLLSLGLTAVPAAIAARQLDAALRDG